MSLDFLVFFLVQFWIPVGIHLLSAISVIVLPVMTFSGIFVGVR